jgi:FG-GAP-like repeat
MPLKLIGSQFQINTFGVDDSLSGNQQLPQIATLSDGRFAVVYQNDTAGNPSDLESDADVFTTDGTEAFNGHVDVLNYPNNQSQPVLAALPDGSFGVAFTNERHANGVADPGSTNITYMRVKANGQLGLPLTVADNAGNIVDPAIATLADGRQVVVYEPVVSASDDDIALNVVNADGFGTQFGPGISLAVINDSAFERRPAVAATGNNALIVYEDATGTSLGISQNITACLFNGTTNTLGPRFQIADHANQLLQPKVAAIDDHRFVIVYNDNITDIFARIYDITTGTLSPEIEVDQPGGTDLVPSVAGTPDGGFIVAWCSADGSDFNVVARRFNSDGVSMDSPFTVNTLTDNVQTSPSIAVSGLTALVGWTDFGARNTDPSPTGVQGQLLSLATPADFTGNLVGDMLWRNSSGALALWDIGRSGAINGSSFVTSNGAIVAPDPSWSIAATSDFTGDGRTDVLWRSGGAGPLALWTMNGSAVTSSAFITSGGTMVSPDASWTVAGSGDFNFDGKSDLLWRNSTTGALVLWTMNGPAIGSSGFVSSGAAAVNPDPSWTVAGIGDLNGDGKSDIVWRNSASGEVSLWYMNGATVSGNADLDAGGAAVRPGATWSIAGIGDFNADGNADLLWRDSATGSVAIWLMNGATIIGSGNVTSAGTPLAPDASWHIVEVGDFNGDARSDILWRSDSGQLAEWLMKGTTVVSSCAPLLGGAPIAPDAGWQLQTKPTDFA